MRTSFLVAVNVESMISYGITNLKPITLPPTNAGDYAQKTSAPYVT